MPALITFGRILFAVLFVYTGATKLFAIQATSDYIAAKVTLPPLIVPYLAQLESMAAMNSLRRMRECTATPPENANAFVAISATRQSRTTLRIRPRKISTLAVAIRKARTRPACTACVIAASKVATSVAGGIDDNDHASSKPRECSSWNQYLTVRMVR